MLRAIAIATLLAACGGKSKPAPTTENTGSGSAPAGAACEKGGCSGTVCEEAGTGTVTTCELKAEYACYQSATCERQTDGKCGWTQSDTLTACLANPPKQ